MSDNGEGLETVAWHLRRLNGPEEEATVFPITDGDRSLGWHDTPIVALHEAEARIEALSAKLKLAEAALEQISDVKYPDVDTIYAHRAMIDYTRDQAILALHSIRED